VRGVGILDRVVLDRGMVRLVVKWNRPGQRSSLKKQKKKLKPLCSVKGGNEC